MRSFDKWFSEQGKTPPVEPELPEGVFAEAGKYYAYCCVCDERYELFHDPITEGFDQNMSYCGGSPRCCP